MRLFGKDLGKKDFLRVCYFMLAVIILKIISNFVLPERKLLLEPTTAGCLPWDLYLWVGQKDKPVEFARYDLVAFPARKMAPYVPDGTNIGKLVAGLPGDTVEIRDGNLFINGVLLGDTAYGAKRLNKPRNHWDTRYVLGADEIFVYGSEERSYDSRYWGPYPKHLVNGRITALF